MKCPHCTVEINPGFSQEYLGPDPEGDWAVENMICPNPNCKKMLSNLICGTAIRNVRGFVVQVEPTVLRLTVNPLTSTRSPVPKEVDELFSKDYQEACLIIKFSPKASAALSRRCLQNILREKAGIKKGDLVNEIEQVINSKTLPSHLNESIDAIRVIGNFAAHPIKSKSTGEIVDVEPGEAEWLLDVIESLFDFYFVQPAITKLKKDAINKKLSELGKPPLK
jgi:hypothetical protein